MPHSHLTRALEKKSARAMQLDDEEIERRRNQANELVAAGKIGGAEYGKLGGRPRKIRATELVAQAAREHGEEIVNAFLVCLDPKQPPYVRLQAAKEWLKIEKEETDREDKQVTGDSEDLIAQLKEALSEIGIPIEGELVGIDAGTNGGVINSSQGDQETTS